jgi:Na+/melibiose symporter-like transporter
MNRLPKRVQERAAPHIARAERLVREFEWTWTKAVVAALVLWFLAFTFLGILPSWWLYYAGAKLGWTQQKPWLFRLRDLLASALYGTALLVFIVVPYLLQKWRRRLRSESESRPTGGYR